MRYQGTFWYLDFHFQSRCPKIPGNAGFLCQNQMILVKKDDDQEIAPMEEMDVKKIKEQSASKEIFKDVARAAHTHYFGNVLLPISTFKTPQKWAARDFNILHGQELCATWCTVGLLFPDKLAVVCVFDVSFVLIKMKPLRWQKKTLKLYDKSWKVECRS